MTSKRFSERFSVTGGCHGVYGGGVRTRASGRGRFSVFTVFTVYGFRDGFRVCTDRWSVGAGTVTV